VFLGKDLAMIYTLLGGPKPLKRKSIDMGRKRHAPRLWLDQRPGRGWVILDGGQFIRTGCAESDRAAAEKKFAEYLGDKYKPQRAQTR
jgi:hypothetical protein